MIDCETLDTEGTAAIFQIGAVFFDDNGTIKQEFKADINVLDSILSGGTVNQDTVDWWKTQPAPKHKRPIGLKGGLQGLFGMVETLQPDFVWANGPRFDCVILENAAKSVGLELPWTFRQEGCFRTLRHTLKILSIDEPKRGEVTHDALQDAIDQKNHLVQMWNAITAYTPE